MSTRVIIGARGSDYGMWISKSGKSAASTTRTDLLVDTNLSSPRIIRAGVITNPVLSLTASSSPSVSGQTAYAAITSTDRSGNSVNGVNTAYYYDGGSYNDDGYALYTLNLYFNADHSALSYVPLTHISIGDPYTGGSAHIGDNYPKIYIDNTKIQLAIYQNWDGSKSGFYTTTSAQIWFPADFKYLGAYYWDAAKHASSGDPLGTNGQTADSPKTIRNVVAGASPLSTLQTNCAIHYAVYNTPMVLP
jgi:hypothetical protein